MNFDPADGIPQQSVLTQVLQHVTGAREMEPVPRIEVGEKVIPNSAAYTPQRRIDLLETNESRRLMCDTPTGTPLWISNEHRARESGCPSEVLVVNFVPDLGR
jgi:hypothetical protein